MTHPSRALALAAGAAALLAPSALPAQPAPASPLIVDQNRQDRLPPPAAPATPRLPAPTAAVVPPTQAAPHVKLARVKVVGSTLPPAVLAEAWAGHVGRALDGPTIQALADAISRAYASSDVALYTIAVPRQDMAGGELTIQAVEGYVTNVVVGGDVKGPHVGLVRRYAARLAAEKPLTRRSLERYLSLTRDIPGLTLDAQLRQAKQPGGVVLLLDLKQQRVRADLAFTSNGQRQLGGSQAQGTLTLNDLAAPGDQLRLTAGAPPSDVELFQYYSAAYSARLGSDGLTGSVWASQLFTRPRDTPIRGESTLVGASFDYPLVRGYRQNLNLTLGLDGQDSDNAAFGQNLYSDHTRTIRGSVAWNRSTAKRTLAANLTLSQGLDILGASADRRLTDPTFGKLSAQAAVQQALGEEWVVRLRAAGQASRGKLPGAEQFTLGGDQFGRAFPAAAVLGDSGAAASAELAWRSQTLWPSLVRGSELYAFVDGGAAASRARLDGLAPRRTYDLASGGLGARIAIADKGMIGLEGAKALANPLPGRAPWRLLVSWRLQL